MSDLIRRKDAIDYFVTNICIVDADGYYVDDYDERVKIWTERFSGIPFAEPDRKFLEIVAKYPKICTYPEYEGKPYYSIKYEENGETIVGFGTYKPEVLSQYLKDYFIPSAEPERKKGEWVEYPDCLRYDGAYADDQIVCSACHHVFSVIDNCTEEFDFCPNCGADMRGENEL